MDNIANHLYKSFKDRADNIVNKAASSSEYKEMTKETMKLEDELIKLLPDDFRLFDNYRDLVLKQEAFLIELVYMQGFEDRADMKKLFSENIG